MDIYKKTANGETHFIKCDSCGEVLFFACAIDFWVRIIANTLTHKRVVNADFTKVMTKKKFDFALKLNET